VVNGRNTASVIAAKRKASKSVPDVLMRVIMFPFSRHYALLGHMIL